MKKLGDLYFNKRASRKDLNMVSYDNIKDEKTQRTVEDIIRDARVMAKINNACKDVMKMEKTSEEKNIFDERINLDGGMGVNVTIRVVVLLLG